MDGAPRNVGESQQSIEQALQTVKPSQPSSVIVLVGEAQEAFQVDRELLVQHSKFFKAALTGAFREAKEGQLFMPDTSVRIFRLVFDWLLSKQLPSKDMHWLQYEHAIVEAVGPTDESLPDAAIAWELIMVHLFVFADYYDIPDLRRDIINGFYHYHESQKPRQTPHVEIILAICRNLPESSQLYRYFANYCCLDSGTYRAVGKSIHQRQCSFLELPSSVFHGCWDEYHALSKHRQNFSEAMRKAQQYQFAQCDVRVDRYLEENERRFDEYMNQPNAQTWDEYHVGNLNGYGGSNDFEICDFHEHQDDTEKSQCPLKDMFMQSRRDEQDSDGDGRTFEWICLPLPRLH